MVVVMVMTTKVMIIIWMISISATSCFLWSGEEPFSNFPEISVTPTDDGDEDEDDDDDDNDIDYEKVIMITMLWMAVAERQKALKFSRLHWWVDIDQDVKVSEKWCCTTWILNSSSQNIALQYWRCVLDKIKLTISLEFMPLAYPTSKTFTQSIWRSCKTHSQKS